MIKARTKLTARELATQLIETGMYEDIYLDYESDRNHLTIFEKCPSGVFCHIGLTRGKKGWFVSSERWESNPIEIDKAYVKDSMDILFDWMKAVVIV